MQRLCPIKLRISKKPLQKIVILLGVLIFSYQALAENQLANIDIKSEQEGITRLVLTLKNNQIASKFNKKNQKLVISLSDVSTLPTLLGAKKLPNIGRLLNGIDVTAVANEVVINVSTKAPFEYDYYQTNNILTIEFKPIFSKVTSDSKANAKLISLNFQDIPVRSVLQMLAEHNQFNLVVADSVTGNLTLKLDEIPWQKALDTILDIKDLDKRRVGNIILVAPKAQLDQQARLLLEKRRNERELASLTSQVIKVNYASAEELKKMLEGNSLDNLGLLTERGTVAVDPRTNSLIIKELSENIEIIKSLVSELDIPVKQVEIEARIVTVDEGTLAEIGVRWGLQSTRSSFSTSGTLEGFVSNASTAGDTSSSIDDMLNVNLGSVNPAAGSIAFQVANLGKGLLLDLELSALQAESRAEIISSPRLLTTNKRAAYIEQGTEIPYLEASSSGAAAIAFKKAVLSLTVTPQITHDEKLVLDLEVTQDKPGTTIKSGTGEAVAINTQRIDTQVLVNDGETIVLGGIYQHELFESVDKVPLLGDLPGVGKLFRRDYESVGKRELLIFVTPRIMMQ